MYEIATKGLCTVQHQGFQKCSAAAGLSLLRNGYPLFCNGRLAQTQTVEITSHFFFTAIRKKQKSRQKNL